MLTLACLLITAFWMAPFGLIAYEFSPAWTMARAPGAYRTPRQFRARLTPGRTHRLGRIPIHFRNQTRSLGEWSAMLGRKSQHVWRDLKCGVPVADVLGSVRHSGKGDWQRLRRELRRFGL